MATTKIVAILAFVQATAALASATSRLLHVRGLDVLLTPPPVSTYEFVLPLGNSSDVIINDNTDNNNTNDTATSIPAAPAKAVEATAQLRLSKLVVTVGAIVAALYLAELDERSNDEAGALDGLFGAAVLLLVSAAATLIGIAACVHEVQQAIARRVWRCWRRVAALYLRLCRHIAQHVELRFECV